MKHKPGCEFIGFRKTLIAIRGDGPDSRLDITEDGIDYDENLYTYNPKEDFEILFNFCPCCGEKNDPPFIPKL